MQIHRIKLEYVYLPKVSGFYLMKCSFLKIRSAKCGLYCEIFNHKGLGKFYIFVFMKSDYLQLSFMKQFLIQYTIILHLILTENACCAISIATLPTIIHFVIKKNNFAIKQTDTKWCAQLLYFSHFKFVCLLKKWEILNYRRHKYIYKFRTFFTYFSSYSSLFKK